MRKGADQIFRISMSALIGLVFGLFAAIAEGIWQALPTFKLYLLSIGVNVLFYSLVSVVFYLFCYFIFSSIELIKANFLSLVLSMLLSLCGLVVSLIYLYPYILQMSFIRLNPFGAAIFLLIGSVLIFLLWFFILIKIKLKIVFLYFLILIYLAFIFIGFMKQQLSKSSMDIAIKAEATKQRNVILMVNDSLRSDHLSCYGYKKKTSPFLDSLAAEAVLFTRAISHGANTSLSMPSLFTSFYPNESVAALMRKDQDILGQILKKRGYATAAFSANPYLSPELGFAQGFDLFFNFPRSNKYDICLLNLLVKIAPYLNIPSDAGAFYGTLADMNPEIAKFLKLNKDKSFFLYIHTMDAHIPYLPPTKYVKRFIADPKKGYIGDYNLIAMRREEPDWQEVLHNLIGRYDASIFYLDKCISSLWDTLGQLNLQDNTVLIITADYGDEHYEHGQLFHGGNLYEEVIKVPLIIYYPNKLPKGQRISELVAHIDIIPTILDILDLSPEKNIKGLSLLPLILNRDQLLPRDFVLSQSNEKVAVLSRRWKYIATLNEKGNIGATEIYDLLKDPGEKKNLASSALNIKAAMHKQLEHYLQQRNRSKLDLDKILPQLKKQLKALGYIQD